MASIFYMLLFSIFIVPGSLEFNMTFMTNFGKMKIIAEFQVEATIQNKSYIFNHADILESTSDTIGNDFYTYMNFSNISIETTFFVRRDIENGTITLKEIFPVFYTTNDSIELTCFNTTDKIKPLKMNTWTNYTNFTFYVPGYTEDAHITVTVSKISILCSSLFDIDGSIKDYNTSHSIFKDESDPSLEDELSSCYLYSRHETAIRESQNKLSKTIEKHKKSKKRPSRSHRSLLNINFNHNTTTKTSTHFLNNDSLNSTPTPDLFEIIDINVTNWSKLMDIVNIDTQEINSSAFNTFFTSNKQSEGNHTNNSYIHESIKLYSDIENSTSNNVTTDNVHNSDIYSTETSEMKTSNAPKSLTSSRSEAKNIILNKVNESTNEAGYSEIRLSTEKRETNTGKNEEKSAGQTTQTVSLMLYGNNDTTNKDNLTEISSSTQKGEMKTSINSESYASTTVKPERNISNKSNETKNEDSTNEISYSAEISETTTSQNLHVNASMSTKSATSFFIESIETIKTEGTREIRNSTEKSVTNQNQLKNSNTITIHNTSMFNLRNTNMSTSILDVTNINTSTPLTNISKVDIDYEFSSEHRQDSTIEFQPTTTSHNNKTINLSIAFHGASEISNTTMIVLTRKNISEDHHSISDLSKNNSIIENALVTETILNDTTISTEMLMDYTSLVKNGPVKANYTSSYNSDNLTNTEMNNSTKDFSTVPQSETDKSTATSTTASTSQSDIFSISNNYLFTPLSDNDQNNHTLSMVDLTTIQSKNYSQTTGNTNTILSSVIDRNISETQEKYDYNTTVTDTLIDIEYGFRKEDAKTISVDNETTKYDELTIHTHSLSSKTVDRVTNHGKTDSTISNNESTTARVLVNEKTTQESTVKIDTSLHSTDKHVEIVITNGSKTTHFVEVSNASQKIVNYSTSTSQSTKALPHSINTTATSSNNNTNILHRTKTGMINDTIGVGNKDSISTPYTNDIDNSSSINGSDHNVVAKRLNDQIPNHTWLNMTFICVVIILVLIGIVFFLAFVVVKMIIAVKNDNIAQKNTYQIAR